MSTSLTSSKHFISLDKAKKMTKGFRENKKKVIKNEFHGKHVLPTCETFDRDGFDALLAQKGCVGVRAYFGMDEEMQVNLVFVGVNEKGEDILPTASTSLTASAAAEDDLMAASVEEEEETGVILDNGVRCPMSCPPSSSLNS